MLIAEGCWRETSRPALGVWFDRIKAHEQRARGCELHVLAFLNGIQEYVSHDFRIIACFKDSPLQNMIETSDYSDQRRLSGKIMGLNPAIHPRHSYVRQSGRVFKTW